MADLTAADVEQFTGGRLRASEAETVRILKAAYSAVRWYCGWHVSYVEDDEIEIDGASVQTLRLPTMQLIELTSITEDGVALDVDDLYVSRLGLVRKKNGRCWSHHFGAITATMTHGYQSDDKLAGFHQAVLQVVDSLSCVPADPAGQEAPNMVRKRVDDVEYQWTVNAPSVFDECLLAPYRLLISP